MGISALDGERRRILVVDDIELNRTLIEAVLRGATYDVDSVEDGASALAALDAKPYDLVLMDLEMPGLGGHAAAAAIRERRCGTFVRLAALSSHSSEGDRRRSAEVGMAAHIARPIAPHALLAEIERAFVVPLEQRRDPWQRQLYEDWVARLGADRMCGFLRNLRDQLATLSDLVVDDAGDALHKLAHDVASTAGMLGFLEVTASCRTVLEGSTDEQRAREALRAALEAAIDCLDLHLAAERRTAA